jgi:hypothetical protein
MGGGRGGRGRGGEGLENGREKRGYNQYRTAEDTVTKLHVLSKKLKLEANILD